MPITPVPSQSSARPHPSARPPSTDPVVVATVDLMITELVSASDGIDQRRAATVLVTHLARSVLEFLQQRRGRGGLGRAVNHEVETVLDQWRHQIDWSTAGLASARGDLASERAVEGSFVLVRRGRRQSFVCRMENNGRRWTCVRLAPVGLLLPVRPDRQS